MPVESLTVTGLFEGIQFTELKARALEELMVSNYNSKFTETKVERAINDAQKLVVLKTKCLKGFAIIRMKAGYSQYKAPSRMIKPLDAYFYKSATSYHRLEEKTKRWLDEMRAGWKIQNGDPTYMYPGDQYGNVRKIGFNPTPDTDGSDYTVSPDTGIYASSTGPTTTGHVTGQNNAASATVCTDNEARTMSDEGVTLGLVAINVSDGSSGQITAVSGATFTATLTGGTNNTWAIGDSFTVLAGEYGTVVDWADEETFLFSSDIGGITDVTALTGNVYLDYARRPLPLQHNSQYPEIPPDLHQFLPYAVPFLLKKNAPRSGTDEKDAMMSYQIFLDGISSYSDQENYYDDDCCMAYHLP